MTWKIFALDHFDQHADDWDALVRAGNAMPFLQTAFLRPLLAEFGGDDVRLALARSDGRLDAAALLTRAPRGLWQTFQPSQLPLGAWVSAPGCDLEQLTRELIGALPGLALGVGLTQLDPRFQPRPAASPHLDTLDYIETAWVDIDGPFETYWDARGKNLKTNVRKQRTKLENEGTVIALTCVTDPAGVAEAMQDYGALEGAGWKAQDGTAVLPDTAQGRFYRRMLENFCALGRGYLYRYNFDDKTVAMDLCIASDDTLIILKTAYDENYRTISPSTLMRHAQFQELFARDQFKRIEFYGRIMEWHTRWTDQARTLYHLNAYRWPLLRRVHTQLRQRHQAAAETGTPQ